MGGLSAEIGEKGANLSGGENSESLLPDCFSQTQKSLFLMKPHLL